MAGWGWVVGKSDFNENPVVSLDLDFGLRLRVCQFSKKKVSSDISESQATYTPAMSKSLKTPFNQLIILESCRHVKSKLLFCNRKKSPG